MQSFDIFMILLLIVVVGFIIGLNIVSVVDKKLGNIAINVPPITIPKPTVIVKIDQGGKYDIYVENDTDKKNKLVLSTDNQNEHFENSLNISSDGSEGKEHFGSIRDYATAVTSGAVKQEPPIENVKVNVMPVKGNGNLTNPDPADVVDYGNYVCYKKGDSNEAFTTGQKITPIPVQNGEIPVNVNNVGSVCGNKSLVDLHSHGNNQLPVFDVQGLHNNDNPDPADYYKRNAPMVAHLEDQYLRGYNIYKSGEYARINEIGIIKLDDAGIYPTPSNYINKPITQKPPKYDQL
jgi:hypothetical protein